MKIGFAMAIAVAAALASGAVAAKTPGELSDLVGAKAAGAESDLQSRGYVNVKNNTWWNGGTQTCVKIRVSQGRYASISALTPASCGQAGKAGGAKSTNGKKCPADLSQADLYKYPGCPM